MLGEIVRRQSFERRTEFCECAEQGRGVGRSVDEQIEVLGGARLRVQRHGVTADHQVSDFFSV